MGPLENLTGKLAEILPEFEVDTIESAACLSFERLDNPKLRYVDFLTNNFVMYRVENGEPTIYFGIRSNPIFKNIKRAASQLIDTGHYFPSKNDIESIIIDSSANPKRTLRVKLSDLGLRKFSDDVSDFKIDTKNPARFKNKYQKEFAERIYGDRSYFKNYMEMLNKEGVDKTEVTIYSPEYVKKKVKQYGILMSACVLYTLGAPFNSRFSAVLCHSSNPDFTLRGILKGISDKKEPSQADSLRAIRLITRSEGAVRHVDEEAALRLLKIATEFYNRHYCNRHYK